MQSYNYDYDICVIGAGAAGLTIASGASRLGAKTLLIEKEPVLGGDCLHYGCVPSKTLIKTANVFHLIKKSKDFGLPEINPAAVDFEKIRARIKGVIDQIQEHDSVERFCKLGVKVMFGAPYFADEHTINIDGRRITAKKIVIATGSSPAIPPFKGLDRVLYLTNKEIFYIDKLPQSMVILGAGPIAIEMAQAFNRLGTKVSVVQRSSQILSREDGILADELMAILKEEGVNFYLDSSVTQIEPLDSDLKRIHIEQVISGQKKQIIILEADTILVATGRSPNIKGLELDKISLQYDKKGLIVDERLRTNHKHIFAAGDITGKYLFTHAAGYEGSVVVTNAIFNLPRKTDYTLMPRCTFTDPEFACIGMSEKEAKEARISYSVWTEEFFTNDRSLAEGYEKGRIRMIMDSNSKPIGIQILGPHAGEILNGWIVALNGKIKLSTLAGSVFPYPTFSEINKKIAGSIVSKFIFSDRVKNTLKFFFGFKGRACGSCNKM